MATLYPFQTLNLIIMLANKYICLVSYIFIIIIEHVYLNIVL